MLASRSVLLPIAVVMLAIVPVGTTWAGTSSMSPQSQKQVSAEKGTHHRLVTAMVKYGADQARVRVNYRRHTLRPVPHRVLKNRLRFSLDCVVSTPDRPKNESSKDQQSPKISENNRYRNVEQSVAQKPTK